jgi:hypothetical protein
MYLGYQKGKIKFYTEQPLDIEQYNLDKVEETEDEYALSADGTEYVLKDAEWEEEQTKKRQEDFYSNFLDTSLGNYRLKPKGYANAQQSIDTINNIVTAMGGLNETIAQMVIFYETPDFSDPEQCTEEWLVEHQTHPEPMTLQEWVQFYIEFTTLYAQKIYKGEQNDNQNN